MHRPAVASLWRFTRSIALSVALLTGSAAAPSHQEPDVQQARSTATVVADHRLSVASPTETDGQNIVTNGSFDDGTVGWTVNSPDVATLTVASGYSGIGARLGTSGEHIGVLNDIGSTVPMSVRGTRYSASVWVRTDNPNVGGHLRVREVSGDRVVTHKEWFWLEDDAWHEVEFSFTSELDGAAVAVNVLGYRLMPDRGLYIDEIALSEMPGPETAPDDTAAGLLTNGCEYNRRGLPACGAYFGAAHGGNTDPSRWEARMGRHLGVHRTYWRPDQIRAAVDVAADDLANQRLPWISFKLPYSWTAMADGRGDAWAMEVAERLAALDGPVWLAFHHEPEGDGAIGEWQRMQEHLAPMVRSTADNVAYTVILTGWNQLYGPDEFSFANLWPQTTIDVAGFDVFQSYGQVRHGRMTTETVDLEAMYFEPLSAWAQSVGVAWGLAETGYSDQAARLWPDWPQQTYSELVDQGGVAFSYFDTDLNSNASWDLADTPAKAAAFAEAISGTPTLPDRWSAN